MRFFLRLSGHAFHAKRSNEVLPMDFLSMGLASDHFRYLLFLRDDLSSCACFFPTITEKSESAAEDVLSWIAAFGCNEWLVTDQGSHFLNSLMQELTEELVV